MIDLFLQQPSCQWQKMICLSRRTCQWDIVDPRVIFLSIDILNATVDDLVQELSKVNGQSITDVFHYTYIEKKSEEELDQVN